MVTKNEKNQKLKESYKIQDKDEKEEIKASLEHEKEKEKFKPLLDYEKNKLKYLQKYELVNRQHKEAIRKQRLEKQ
jgi:hypothetical protein